MFTRTAERNMDWHRNSHAPDTVELRDDKPEIWGMEARIIEVAVVVLRVNSTKRMGNKSMTPVQEYDWKEKKKWKEVS